MLTFSTLTNHHRLLQGFNDYVSNHRLTEFRDPNHRSCDEGLHRLVFHRVMGNHWLFNGLGTTDEHALT